LSGSPLEAFCAEKVAAGVREATRRAHHAGGGGVQFGGEAVGFGRLGEVAIQAEHVVDRRAAGRVSPDVGGAVVTVGDHVNVQPTTATWSAPFADFGDRVDRAVKGTGDGSEQGAYGAVVQAGGVV
jgi:hypothetical protein